MAISTVNQPVSLWQQYFALCKPKVVALILFTAFVGMLLASDGVPEIAKIIWGLLGIGMAAGSAAAINHIIDQRIDRIMMRTCRRPLATGMLNTVQASSFAFAMGIISMVILVYYVNPLTAILTFASLIGYAVIYTVFLKYKTPQNIVWGGAAGAMPPLLGWCAITGEVTLESIFLFLIIFIWTPPHFWALAIHRKKEYEKANIPMLPVTHGIPYTKRQVLLYSIALFVVSLLPYFFGFNNILYLLVAILLNIGFVYHTWSLYRSDNNKLAMKTFSYSITYLIILFAFLLLDHFLMLMKILS
ncbi:MAG: heme o synthase [Cocleimonas sp.]|nr:heme o synthase [Cocleimonas sp.]